MESLSIGALSDKAVRYLTGLKRSKLASLADEISVDVEHLFQFYLLCRQNLSQRALAILISVDQSTISRRFHKILDKLADYLIPKYLTFSLDEVRSRVPPMVKKLFPDVELLGVLDGTYWYTQKSESFDVQSESYCLHKHANLYKSMGVGCLDGTWWDLIGCYYSNTFHNDELMFEHIIDNNTSGMTPSLIVCYCLKGRFFGCVSGHGDALRSRLQPRLLRIDQVGLSWIQGRELDCHTNRQLLTLCHQIEERHRTDVWKIQILENYRKYY